MNELDPAGLEAAAKAMHADGRGLPGFAIRAGIRAYLAAAPVPPDDALIAELREDPDKWSFRALVRIAQLMLDTTYPDDVFGSGPLSLDAGARFTAKLREALRCVDAEPAPVPPDGEPPDTIPYVPGEDREVTIWRAGFAAGRAAATPDPPDGPIPGPDPGACPRCGEWRKAGMIHRCPAATPDPPREEWRVVDGDNVVCRLAGHRDFGTFRPWAEEQCRGLVERFPGESFRIERRVGDEEWEAWCPPDTPMGSCVPRCGDARCEVAAGRAAATPDPPREVTTDAGDAANGPSVPDQTRRIVVYDARHGRGGLDVPVGCTVGEAALLAAEMFGVRVGPNDRPSFGLRGTGLHPSDPLPDDEDYDLFVI